MRVLTAKKKPEHPAVAIDFDGTIVKEMKYPEMGLPEPGVIEAIEYLKNLGFRILIHTCRLNGWKDDIGVQAAAIANHLTKYGVPYDELVLPGSGKPFAEYYIDNKGLRYTGDWSEMVNFIEEREKKIERVSARVLSVNKNKESMMDNVRLARELLKLAKSLVGAQLPSEEQGGKPEHDEDFKAGFEAAKKVIKSKVRDTSDAKEIYNANQLKNRVFGRVKSKHGTEWLEGWDGAFSMAQGLFGNTSYQVAKKMGLK